MGASADSSCPRLTPGHTTRALPPLPSHSKSRPRLPAEYCVGLQQRAPALAELRLQQLGRQSQPCISAALLLGRGRQDALLLLGAVFPRLSLLCTGTLHAICCAVQQHYIMPCWCPLPSCAWLVAAAAAGMLAVSGMPGRQAHQAQPVGVQAEGRVVPAVIQQEQAAVALLDVRGRPLWQRRHVQAPLHHGRWHALTTSPRFGFLLARHARGATFASLAQNVTMAPTPLSQWSRPGCSSRPAALTPSSPRPLSLPSMWPRTE